MNKDEVSFLSWWRLYLTPQERLVLGVLCAVIFFGSVLQYCFKRMPSAAAKMEYIESRRWQGKVNINTAGEEELKKVPYLGAAMARRIIAYRQDHGLFAAVSDLMAVKGIGAANFRAVEPFVAVE
jgi:competence ComEA-like helix-hairpin-helix protein